ncbi:NUDIX hydrolase [Brevundimonas sp.]|uniref:NUDIX domain-containing protein n=1 Tax=Brevundimonas sp. TaxID=1871086 RepID=UPI0025DCDFFF|nr:NUDIX hydrolase [Brevundimonas sp.]
MTDEPDWLTTDKPTPWERGPAQSLFENPWMEMIAQQAVAPTGREVDYAWVHFRNVGVGVLPIHDDGTVVLVGQQRFTLANFSWEMPEGGAPLEEDPFEGVKRELAEEARLRAGVWRPALSMELSNSITDERAMTWLAWDLSACEGELDGTEVLVLARVPFQELLAAIGRGQVRDAMTVATAYKAHHMAVTGELPPKLARAMLG